MGDSAAEVKGDILAGGMDVDAERKRPQPDGDEDGGAKTSTAHDAKRQRKADGNVDKPPASPPNDPNELKVAIRKQIEYYFSDANMKHDKFFQDKIKENPDSWLNIGHLLSCRNISRLGVTSPDTILNALTESDLETKTDATGSMWVRRTTPLPPLEDGGKQKKPKRDRVQKLVDMSVLHDAGCFTKAVGCPEEASWEAVKTALAAKLPEKARIRFASQLQQDGTCYLYTFRFENDKQMFADKVTIDVAGAPVEVSLITDAAEATKVVRSILPAHIAQQRDRVLNPKNKSAKNTQQKGGKKGANQTPICINTPIIVGGTDFKSVNHLRDCVKELLAKTAIGTVLPEDKLAHKVISAVLKYHPRAEEKMSGMVGLKVDEICKGDKPTKCFFVLRKAEAEGEHVAEDFSVLKCLAELQTNPPLKDQPTCAAAAAGVGGEDQKTDGETTKTEKTEATTVKAQAKGEAVDEAAVGC